VQRITTQSLRRSCMVLPHSFSSDTFLYRQSRQWQQQTSASARHFGGEYARETFNVALAVHTASRRYCNEPRRHFRIISSKTERIWTKLGRDGEWGKSDPVKVLARSPQKPQRKGRNTNLFS